MRSSSPSFIYGILRRIDILMVHGSCLTLTE